VYHDVAIRPETNRNVPVELNGVKLIRIGEALSRAGLSRATYFRWIKEGRIPDARFRDRNGRRVFTERELAELESAANQVVEAVPGDQSQLSLQLPRGAL
jgi:hypothetical protein